MIDPPAGRGHYMYVLACADGSLYTGYAIDVSARLAAHQAGKGAKYTRARRPVALQAWWSYDSKPAAMAAEAAFKRLKRASKVDAIAAHLAQSRPTPASSVSSNVTKRS